MRTVPPRRWLLFGLAVVVLAYGCWRLGQWQFDRLDERESRNASTRVNLAAEPAPVEAVLDTQAPLPGDQEWRRVTATGVYDPAGTVVLRYQTRDGRSGVDLVTPLVTGTGTAVLVDRGWVETANSGEVPQDLPAPPTGRVSVVGWARADATGEGTEVVERSVRALSSRAVASTVNYPLYAGFLDLQSETPAAPTPLVRAEPPDLGEGPHFFYGLQWWFFALLAVTGFGYLIWDERRGPRRRTADKAPSR